MKIQTLVERHAKDIKGVIECFDRVVLFGTYKASGWTGAMEQHLRGRGTSFMEFNKRYANELRLEVADHVRTLARDQDIEIRQVNYGQRKESLVEEILAQRGRREGVVCVLGAIERCRCFKVGKNQTTGFLQLQWSPGKCQHFYVYFIDAEFGLCHLRIPTWAPFRLQFCCNGHDWLERQMRAAGIRFKKADNCFTHISDFAAAQARLKKFEPQRLHRMLDQLAARWVAVHGRFGHSLHWSVYQAEWRTDIVFQNDLVLPELYRQIVRPAAIEVGCADIYRFMGKKPRAHGKAEPSSRLQTLVQGTRLKHTLGATSLKMYDKVGRVLRMECTTSDVTTFKHHRKVEPRRSAGPGQGQSRAGSSGEKKWTPMRKTFYSLGAVTASRRDEKDRSVRGVNFFRADDLQFLRALQRGEHQIQGVRNRTLQPHLPGWKPSRIGHTLRRFRVLKLIKPVAGTRKYYPTAHGESLVIAGLQLTERIILPAFAA